MHPLGTVLVYIFGAYCAYSFVINLIRFRITDMMIVIAAFIFIFGAYALRIF